MGCGVGLGWNGIVRLLIVVYVCGLVYCRFPLDPGLYVVGGIYSRFGLVDWLSDLSRFELQFWGCACVSSWRFCTWGWGVYTLMSLCWLAVYLTFLES